MATCKTCPHYASSRDAQGRCLRFPPTVLPGGQAVPIVRDADHCGEHPERQIVETMASGPTLSEMAARIQPPRGRKRK